MTGRTPGDAPFAADPTLTASTTASTTGERTLDGPTSVDPKHRRGLGRLLWRMRNATLHAMDAVPLSTKLVAAMMVLLIVGVVGITIVIRQMVGTYLLDKTDAQLQRQATLVFNNIRLLSQEDNTKNGVGPTDYYLQIRDRNLHIMPSSLTPRLPGGVVSTPRLPEEGSMGSVVIGQTFTTPASVSLTRGAPPPDPETIRMARAPWRVVAMQWEITGDSDAQSASGVLFIGLSLNDMQDTISILTRYCIMVGAAIVLLGSIIAALMVQRTLRPLKRIEKTAAKIAAGDLSQRIPSAPENTEVGSLSFSLNTMLARIEQSFREQSETTDKMKRFVSDASHELRTPLAAIHGYAELYKMQRDYPGALERADASIGRIEASSSRMTVLVEDLLSLARLDEGRGIDLNQQADLTTLITDGADDLHALDPTRLVQLGTVELNPGVPPSASPPQAAKGRQPPKRAAGEPQTGRPPTWSFVSAPMPKVSLRGDPSRLRQVVTNIVGNIHRYTPNDSPVQMALGIVKASITPRMLARMASSELSMARFIEAVQVAQSTGAGQRYAVVIVTDHGPGVPAEGREKLFERFYTADPSRAREKGGTGLGLAIVQSVVRAHHGLICASQTPGGGLTFSIVLPVVEAKSAAAPAAKPAVRRQSRGAQRD